MFKEIFSRSSKSSLNGGEVKSFTPQLAAFLEQLPTAVLVLKSSGKIEFANEAAGVLLQETGKKLKGVHVGKLGITEASLQELVVDSPAKRVLTIADMQANSFKVHVGAKLLGESPFILLTLEEIPLLSRLEKEKTFLITVLENHPLPVTVQDREGNCIVASAQARKLFGFSEQATKQKPLYELLPKEITVSLQRLDEEAWASATRLDPVRLAYKSAEEHERMLSVSKAVLPGADGKPCFIVTVYEEITKHYEWEQDLQHSQKLLQAILDNIPLGVYTRDCDTKVTFINRQGLQILGEQPATLEKKHDQQTQEESDSYIQREQSILKDGKTYECPAEEYVDSSGKKRAVHVIKVPLTDAGPKPLVLTIVDDITKRQQQEREIKRVNSMLSAIVQNAPIALYARAENGRMLLRNKQCNALFGDAKEEDFDERSRLPHETDEQVTQYLNREQEILRKGETLDIPEEEYTTSHGETKLLHMVKAPVPGDTPESRCVITLVEDITIKKEQERALVESKNFLQTVINQLPVSLSVKDYNGKYILWNKKSEELFGVQARDVIGKDNYRTDLNKDQAEFVRETDLRVFESHREQNIPQELISSAQDGIKIMHTVKTPVYNPDGTPNCLLVVSEDITAKTKMEKQIMEASDKNTLLVENAREGVVILEDGKIIYANRAFCTLLGFDTLEDIKGKKLLDFSTENHLVFLKEKYEAVLAGTDTKAEPIEAHFVRKNGSTVEAKFAGVLSKYLGRRIMLGFASDVTASNRVLRELKKERDNFRQSFENSSVPSFILSAKGYVSVMNEACRKLLGFSEDDKNFYCNVYVRPGISLAARKQMRKGLPAEMDYVLDFDRFAKQFPQWIHQQGKLPLHVLFAPIAKRDAKDGSVEAEYLVSLQLREQTDQPQPPQSGKVLAKEEIPSAVQDWLRAPQEHEPEEAAQGVSAESLPPLPPFLTPKHKDVEPGTSWILPNSEPYALCNEDFTVVSCNDLFCSLCELQEDELKGQDIRRLFHPDEKPRIDQDFQLLRKEGKLSNREYTIHLGSGLETCKVRLMAVKEEEGTFLFVLHSLAFHLQIMKILEERSAQLSALRYALDGAVLRIEMKGDKLGQLEQLNNWLSVRTGYLHEELAQMAFSDLFADPVSDELPAAATLARAQRHLAVRGKASFSLPLRRKDGSTFEAHVTLVGLDIPSQQSVLAVVEDLTARQEAYAKDSREAQELAGLRQTLPGLYLKMDNKGKVLEVSSNLSYVDNTQAQKLFLGKTPEEFWSEEAASNALFTIKEAMAVHISSHFEFEWKYQDVIRYYEATVMPLKKRREAVLWVRDMSEKRIYDQQVHDLYRLSQETKLGLTTQVEKILALGKKIFQADIGLVLRFERNQKQLASSILYTTPNWFRLERHMEFPVEECLRDVADGTLVLWPNLEATSCENCLHQQKRFGSLLAAPLFINGKVEGALCFAARDSKRSFVPGAEEMLGLMARLLGLRIELRQTGKTLGDTMRSFTRMLEYVKLPALTIDPDFQITFANEALADLSGMPHHQLLGKELFSTLVRQKDMAQREFWKALEQDSDAVSFTVRLETLQRDGSFHKVTWDVFVCQNGDGKVDGYALMARAVR